ncbi:MAG: outer membrane protein [Patescibacteria group bacterium]|jgi:outer membrane protein
MSANSIKRPRHFSPSEGELASNFKPQKTRFSFRRFLRKWLSPLFCLAFVSISTNGNAQSIEQLSLTDFLEMATQQNIAAQEAQLDIKQADWNYKLYKAGLKPNLSASANFPNFARTFREIVQPDGTIQFQPIRNNNSTLGLSLVQNIPQTGGTVFLNSGLQRFDDFENDTKLYNGNPIQIGLYQPLFGFNSMKWDKKLEPIKQTEAQKKFNVDLLAIQTTATTLFFDLLVAYQEAEIAKNNEESNQQLFEIAEERLSLGRISKGGLKQLQLELISAQQSRRRAEQSVFYASAAIYDFLGRPYNEEAIQPVFPEEVNKEIIDPTTALQKALTNHHDPISRQRMLLEVNRDLEKAKRESGLQVDINASFGLVRSSKKIGDIYNDPKQEQFAQLQLTVPILDWGARKAQVGIAQAQHDFTQRSVAQQKRTFETTVRQTAEEVNFLIQDLELTESIQKIALERFEITKESYVLGSISITELTLAQREKDQAQRQYTRTVREYWEAKGRLAGFVGSIN